MNKKRNIIFFPKSNKIRYNAIKKFNDSTIKIPTYIINEVFQNKMKIAIYHNNSHIVTYSYDNLFSFIQNTDKKEYKGKFRRKDIIYKLSNVAI